MRFPELMDGFVRRLGLGRVEPEEGDRYSFTFDGDLVVRIFPAGRGLAYLTGSVAGIPAGQHDADERLKRLLKLNLARMRKQREILAVDPEAREIILYAALPLEETGVDGFSEAVEGFLNTLEYWRSAAKESASPPPTMVPFIFP